ncbi:NAD(P)-dependent oxidoreductase [Veillonella sp. R32]|uniref:NAD-dependent epimerase/dehydratase family protein n=1 Tax=Veillonella sp. R32 TaxID=2021312 RepID=UPI001389FCFF|nr:NAD(P)-dependent oxidoreductase [Veillonella sp. R32]KAF1680108.1 hypothetical protein VER_08715 [Veillonella sp. R32]
MRIAILGASSFIGKKIIEAMYKKNHEIIAVIRKKNSNKDFFEKYKGVQVIESDMDEYTKVAKKLSEVDCLIYLAWDGTRGSLRNDFYRQKRNYELGINCIKAFVDLGCKKVITAGSQAEYGLWQADRKLTEEDIAKPNTEYGKFKLKLYEDSLELSKKYLFTLIEPRFFSLYGPSDYEGTMIISVLKKMLINAPCDLTECKQIWDFLYIDDAVRALVKLIEEDHPTGIYNFGSGESHDLKYYIEIMKKITESKSLLHYGVIEYPETGMVNVNPSVRKLNAIGWTPQISFENGIHNVLEALKLDKG